jgi:hypothetical protein
MSDGNSGLRVRLDVLGKKVGISLPPITGRTSVSSGAAQEAKN